MSDKVCDHTSVGMLVWNEGKLLLIERMKYPFGFAPPAGHVDGDPSFEAAAERELKEEVGLDAVNLNLLWEGRRENPCRRIDGTWHYWKIFQVDYTGELNLSLDETKQARWFTQEEIAALEARSESYLKGEISEEDWIASPGLEPTWYEFAQKVGLNF